MDKYGYESGDLCNRYGCLGVIEETDKRGCSCHINPPCSACTEPRAFCPVCGWSDAEERELYEKTNKQQYKRIVFPKIRTFKDLDKSKIDYLVKGHTHFTMIKEGVYPIGTSREELGEKIRGTFGGRFVYLTQDKFKYIAYTD